MKYDFNTVVDRKNTDSIKYDFTKRNADPDWLLPMWVADMDFPLPAEVLENIHKTVAHGIFGYTEPTAAYYNALEEWFRKHFGYTVPKEEVVLSPGIVFALAQMIRAFTNEGDGIIIQTPVYYPFAQVIRNNNREIAANPLVYEQGQYTMDFEGFERLAERKKTKMFILCSPHNPVGRVWTCEELSRINEICMRHRVLVVSDEIHCDFTWQGYKHTCYGLLDENAIICTAPSKTFNLAGLQISNLFIRNAKLRSALKAEINKTGYSQLNTAGLAACRSVYEKGDSWLTQLKEYIQENIAFARANLQEQLPKIKWIEPEGTYLLWLDFSNYGLPQSELDRRITEHAGLWLDSGTMFGEEGEGFQRINVACPRYILTKALERLKNEFQEMPDGD